MTSPYQPQSNALAKLLKRTLMEAGLCALQHSELPERNWDCAVLDAVYN